MELFTPDVVIAVTGAATAVIVEFIKWVEVKFGIEASRERFQLFVGVLALLAALIYTATPNEIIVEAGKIIATAIAVYEILIKNVYRKIGA